MMAIRGGKENIEGFFKKVLYGVNFFSAAV